MSAPCKTGWCADGCDGSNHSTGGTYVPAIHSMILDRDIGINGVNLKSVGIGVRYNAVDGLPAIFVHINGGGHDVEADLDWHAAQDLGVALAEAIAVLHETLRGGIELKPRQR